jgi:hypothetical protein
MSDIEKFALFAFEEEDVDPVDDTDEFHIKEPGTVTFFVYAKESSGKILFEVDDYSGCAFWAKEGTGLDWWIEDIVDLSACKVGCHYTVEGMSVDFTQGEWGFTDDTEDWYYDTLTVRWKVWERLYFVFRNRYFDLKERLIGHD